MLRFPLDGLLDEQDCYEFLLRILHPDGLYCPRSHPLPASQASHRRRRPIIPDYRCRQCGAVFNLFTSTIWWKTCYRCSTIVQILRGIAQGTPTQHLADELAINRTHLLERRHEIRTLVASHFSLTTPLSDPVAEADELYQNAGEKGRKHTDPSDPPRRRANQARGHGTWASDHPPIVGIVGRCSGQIRLRLCRHSDRATLEPLLLTHTRDDAIINTDEWSAYQHLAATGRIYRTVCHTPGEREWARDDGDGIREVHNNTMEGIWTGCRNFLRFFRGISKWFLAGYIAVFECSHNLKWVTPTLMQAMMTPSTTQPTGADTSYMVVLDLPCKAFNLSAQVEPLWKILYQFGDLAIVASLASLSQVTIVSLGLGIKAHHRSRIVSSAA